MNLPPFIGREEALDKLLLCHNLTVPTLVVVKGRRRIGKSRLIAEMAARLPQYKLWSFAGLAPQKDVTAQAQRDHFAQQLAALAQLPSMTFGDWSDALAHLSLHIKPGDIILFDEISWMGAGDPTFIPKLKAWWDKQVQPIFAVFCGSVSSWIEENILSNTAFFGRVNLTLTLEPLSIPESARLLQAMGFQGSAYDIYKLLSVLGGIPWYLEQARPGISADNLIRQLCFEKDGLLVLEFKRIFHDLFDGKGEPYKKILVSLKDGMRTLAQVRRDIDYAHSGTLSQMMENLIIAGFVKKQNLWSFKTAQALKQSLYRICDPYMRFYLKMIETHEAKITLGAFAEEPLSRLPGFEAHMGLQLKYLLLQNRPLLLKSLGISPGEVVCDGPYLQTQTSKQQGCQVDYLIQTATNNLYVCEFKFKRREIGVEIINEMKAKTSALKIPRGYAAVPVLFHISGVTAPVETEGYFYRIIDIVDFLDVD